VWASEPIYTLQIKEDFLAFFGNRNTFRDRTAPSLVTVIITLYNQISHIDLPCRINIRVMTTASESMTLIGFMKQCHA